MRRAVFLDRDGTLIEDVGHLHRVEDVRLLPGTGEAVRRLNEAGWFVVVATNQSVIARGMLTEEELRQIHTFISQQLAEQGARIDAWYYCPHHPNGVVEKYSLQCSCRKPEPGMLLQASKEYGLDLSKSWFVGDSASDAEAGRRVGVRTLVLGVDAETLAGAVDIILKQ